MCTKIQSLRCHPEELKIEPENYENKPAKTTLTETMLTKNDGLENDYNSETCQSNESKPSTSCQEREGAAFYVQENIKDKVIEFHGWMFHQTNIFATTRKLTQGFTIDTTKESKDKSEYEKLLLAFDFKRQSFETTRVTPTSANYFDHVVTSK